MKRRGYNEKRSAILMGILACSLAVVTAGCGGKAEAGGKAASEAESKSEGAKHVGIIFTEAGLGATPSTIWRWKG